MSLKHNEIIKLTANYWNGMAIAFFAVGCIGIAASLLIKDDNVTVSKILAYVVFLTASIACHFAGRKTLGGLRE